MPKNQKIKRYNRIYRTHRSPSSIVLNLVGAIALIGVLGFIGWSAYGPVMDYLSGVTARLSKPASASVSSDAAVSTPELSEPETKPVNPEPSVIKAVYLPSSLLSDFSKLDALLDSISLTEINAVLFDLKDDAGNVLYRSQSELVTQANSQVQTPYDLAALCEKLSTKHLVPIGRLNAFRDPIAASRIPDAGVKYMNSEMLWLDNSADAGGKPWLNPYSDLAQAYITDIATECVSLGVKRIMLDNVSFPTGYGQEFSTYGINAANQTRQEVLSAFIDSIDGQVTDVGGELSLYISGLAALGAQNTYYASNPLTLANSNITLGVMPAQFGDAFTLENFSLTVPIANPKETVDSLLKFLAPDITGMNVTALVQGYTSNSNFQNNKVYTAEDINAQISALAANGVDSYIIYAPDGNYPN